MIKLLAGRLSGLFISGNARPISIGSCHLKNEGSSQDQDTSVKKILITENLPPIPPNKGFPGDENIRSIFEMKRIRKSFRYGVAPHLIRYNNPGPMIIRLLPITHCRNRRFYRIAVTRSNYEKKDGFIEDIGSIDPLPNRDNSILVAINIERLKYYLGKQVPVKGVVGQLLGLAGFFPVHPASYLKAYRNRQTLQMQEEEKKKALEEAEKMVAQKTA